MYDVAELIHYGEPILLADFRAAVRCLVVVLVWIAHVSWKAYSGSPNWPVCPIIFLTFLIEGLTIIVAPSSKITSLSLRSSFAMLRSSVGGGCTCNICTPNGNGVEGHAICAGTMNCCCFLGCCKRGRLGLLAIYPQRCAAAFLAMAVRSSCDRFCARAFDPACPERTLPDGFFKTSRISPVAMRPTIMAQPMASAGRFWPWGPCGIKSPPACNMKVATRGQLFNTGLRRCSHLSKIRLLQSNDHAATKDWSPLLRLRPRRRQPRLRQRRPIRHKPF
jgi:hypothetical protein